MPTSEETDGVDVGDGVIMLPERSPAPHVQPVGPRQPLPPQWTYRIPNRSETPLVGQEIHGGKPLIRFETYGSAVNMPVDQAYFERLQPRGWLTNHLVDLYLSEVTNTYFEAGDVGRLKEFCLLPTSAFYTIQETKGRWLPHTQLDKWDSALDHTFVAFPLNAHRNHWLLGILTYASDLLQEHNSAGPIRTSVVILNSISSHNPSNLEQRVRQMIKVLAIGKALRHDGIKTLKFFYPLVPQQPNDVDCGLYPGHFLSVFLTDPSRFADHCTGEKKIAGLVGEIWKASLIPTAREALRELAESVAVIRKASLLFHSGRTPSDLKTGT